MMYEDEIMEPETIFDSIEKTIIKEIKKNIMKEILRFVDKEISMQINDHVKTIAIQEVRKLSDSIVVNQTMDPINNAINIQIVINSGGE